MKKFLAIVFVGLSPVIASAQALTTYTYNPSSGVNGLFLLIMSWTKIAVPILVALAVVFFLYSVFSFFVMTGEDEEKKKKAKSNMIWGIVAIFVMVSVWGLVGILQSTFNTQTNSGLQGSGAMNIL